MSGWDSTDEALSADSMRRLAPAKIFSDQKQHVNSMDFSDDGQYLVAASEDESLRIFDCHTGMQTQLRWCKKYGVDLARFTHASKNIVCASSNEWDHTLRHMAVFDNQYLRYFKGHRDKVLDIAMCSKSDTFISASLDRTVRLWDLSTPACLGVLHTETCERSCVSYDPEDRIFAAVTEPRTLKLFDVRAFDKGPFATFSVNLDRVALTPGDKLQFTAMEFSPDGKWILLSTNRSAILLLDAYDGDLKTVFQGHKAQSAELGMRATFSPDGQFVLSGSDDGKVHVWDLSGRVVCAHAHHPAPTQNVLFNPTMQLMASACHNVSLWLPAPLH